MITNFWTWLLQAVSLATTTLNQMINDYHCGPFFQLFLVVLALGVIMKYILYPIIAPGSDKAKRKEEKE